MESDLCDNERQDLLDMVDLKSTYIRVTRDILRGINLDPDYLGDPAERMPGCNSSAQRGGGC